MRPMLAKEAQELLYTYMQRLFRGRAGELESIRPDQSMAEEAKQAIIDMSEDLNKGVETYPLPVQRYIYEVLVHSFSLLCVFEPDRPLPEPVDDWMSDDEKLSRLLKSGIPKMIDLMPRNH